MSLPQRVERTVRDVTLRTMMQLAGQHDGDAGPLPPAARILLLRHDRVGDMIMTTGLLHALAAGRPDLTIDVLASPANASIARREHRAGDVITHPPAAPRTRLGMVSLLYLIRRLRAARYHAVLDGFVLRPRVNLERAALMLACGARRRVGIGGREGDIVYTDRIPSRPPGTHHVEVLGELAKIAGLDPATLDLRPRLSLTAAEKAAAAHDWRRAHGVNHTRRLLVNVSAGGDARRRWPDDHFAALLAHVRSRHPAYCPLLIALPAERDAVTRLAAATKVEATFPPLFEAFALVESASLFVTPDTGLAHAASAFGTRTLTLCQPGKNAWLPWRTPGGAVVADSAASLATLPVERVAAALDALIAGGQEEGRRS